jgi:heat-inducible transcriptional repressor
MESLTPRQTEILKFIILEYTQTGEPVGSEILDKKYNLGVSPATVRNEMMMLAKKGFLKKEHFSSGRVPTAQAFRFYIKNLMREKELSTAEEVSYKSDIWDFRNELNRLLQHATRVLAKRTNMMALTTTNQGDIYYFGVTNVLSQREFADIDLSREFFEKLDAFDFSKNILDTFKNVDEEIMYDLGDDNVKDKMTDDCASVFCEFETDKVKGAIGVMGPKRMHYEVIVPNIRYFTSLVQTILKEQGY